MTDNHDEIQQTETPEAEFEGVEPQPEEAADRQPTEPEARPASDEQPEDAGEDATEADEPEAEAKPAEPGEQGEAPQGPKLTVEQIKPILEALLFAADDPLSASKLAEAIDGASGNDVRAALLELQTIYHQEGRGFRLEEIAGGFQLFSNPDYAPYLEKLQKKQSRTKLSAAALETLAIIAYKQPIGRADIESIRGVQVGSIVRMLMDKNMVKIVGREEVIGRPFLYGTTKKFLEHFGLKSLRDLPDADQLKMP